MKIAAIIGSLRKQSYNRMIFNIYKELAGAQMEITEVNWSRFPIYNQDVQDLGMPADVTTAGQQIQAADGILVFSPEYNYSVPGGLKNMIDWLSRLPQQPFTGKPAAILSASPGKVGGARMQYHLRQTAVFLDLKIMNKPEVMIGEVHKQLDAQGKFNNTQTEDFLKKHIQEFIKFCQ